MCTPNQVWSWLTSLSSVEQFANCLRIWNQTVVRTMYMYIESLDCRNFSVTCTLLYVSPGKVAYPFIYVLLSMKICTISGLSCPLKFGIPIVQSQELLAFEYGYGAYYICCTQPLNRILIAKVKIQITTLTVHDLLSPSGHWSMILGSMDFFFTMTLNSPVMFRCGTTLTRLHQAIKTALWCTWCTNQCRFPSRVRKRGGERDVLRQMIEAWFKSVIYLSSGMIPICKTVSATVLHLCENKVLEDLTEAHRSFQKLMYVQTHCSL